MEKSINMVFLESVCPSTIKDRTYDAMLIWLFDTKQRSIAVCRQIAFESMKRRFREFNKMSVQDKQAYYDDVSALIDRCLDDLLGRGLSEQKAFDTWHKENCEELCKMSNKFMRGAFTHGMAQYLLNLTIKHMLLMEQWDKWLDPIRNILHVPVDYKIMEAATVDFGILIPCTNGGVGKYSLTGAETDSKPWEKWEYGEYVKFQEDLRGAVVCPMDWEFGVWSK